MFLQVTWKSIAKVPTKCSWRVSMWALRSTWVTGWLARLWRWFWRTTPVSKILVRGTIVLELIPSPFLPRNPVKTFTYLNPCCALSWWIVHLRVFSAWVFGGHRLLQGKRSWGMFSLLFAWAADLFTGKRPACIAHNYNHIFTWKVRLIAPFSTL